MNNYFEKGPYSAAKIKEHIWHIEDATLADPVGLHEDGTFHNASSVYVIEDTHTVLVIDLGNPHEGHDLRDMVNQIAGERIIKVAITHNHYDHIGAIKDFNDCEVYYHQNDSIEGLNHPMIVKHKDIIKLDTMSFEVLEVFGHTKGSIAFLERNYGYFATGDAFGSSYVWLLFVDNVIDMYQKTLIKTIPEVKEISNLYFLCGHRYQQQFNKIKGVHPLSPRNPDMGILYLEDMLDLTYQINAGIASSHEFEAFNRKDLKAYTYGRAEIDTYMLGHECITL